MRRFAAVAMPVLALIVALTSCAAPPQTSTADPEEAKRAVAEVNQRYLQALQARDSSGMAGLYAENANALPANMPRVSGREAIRAMWGQVMSDSAFSLTFQSTDMIVSQAGDMVVDLGTYAARFSTPAGPANDAGKYVTIFQKINGEWKVIVDTFNSDAAPGQP